MNCTDEKRFQSIEIQNGFLQGDSLQAEMKAALKHNEFNKFMVIYFKQNNTSTRQMTFTGRLPRARQHSIKT